MPVIDSREHCCQLNQSARSPKAPLLGQSFGSLRNIQLFPPQLTEAVGEVALKADRAGLGLGLQNKAAQGLRKQWHSSVCVLTYALIAANAAARALKKASRWKVGRSSSGQLPFIDVPVPNQPLVHRGRCGCFVALSRHNTLGGPQS